MNKKTTVLNIATKLFAERGFDNTSVAMICEEANVSKGLIFHHFKSKNDLLREIFSQTTKMMMELNKTSSSSQTPHEELINLINSVFKQLKTDKMYFQLNLNIMLQPKTREVLNDLIKERSSFLLNSVKSIFKKIDSKNALVMSYMFIAELDGVALNYLCIFEKYPLAKIKKKLIEKYTSI